MSKKIKKLVPINNYIGMTEEERFEKALQKCRNCGHVQMTHFFLPQKNSKCIDASLSVAGKYIVCNCKDWASSNNLEYLEEIYNKKNKGDKHE